MKSNKNFKNYRFYIALPYLLLLMFLLLPFQALTKVFDTLSDWCYELELIVEFNLGRISGVSKLLKWIESNNKSKKNTNKREV